MPRSLIPRRRKAAEDSRTPKRKRMAKLLECGCPLPLFSGNVHIYTDRQFYHTQGGSVGGLGRALGAEQLLRSAKPRR